MKRIREFVGACVLGVLAACMTGGDVEPSWQSLELAAPSENVLWAVAGQEMQRLDFPVGTDADAVRNTMRSGWRTTLAPFRGEGYRVRAELKYERLESGRFRVELRVERENNMDWVRPADPAHAQWEPVADDESIAQVLAQRIRARLGDELEVGPAPVRRQP